MIKPETLYRLVKIMDFIEPLYLQIVMLLIMENVLIVLCNSSNTVTMFFDVYFFIPEEVNNRSEMGFRTV